MGGVAKADLRDLTVINKAANAGHWQAAAWYLERSDPKHWGRRVVIDKERERKPKAPKVIGFNRPGELGQFSYDAVQCNISLTGVKAACGN